MIRHKAGKRNVVADALSRRAMLLQSVETVVNYAGRWGRRIIALWRGMEVEREPGEIEVVDYFRLEWMTFSIFSIFETCIPKGSLRETLWK